MNRDGEIPAENDAQEQKTVRRNRNRKGHWTLLGITCGIYPFHRKRVIPDHFGVNVACLEGFDPDGIPVRETHGSQMD